MTQQARRSTHRTLINTLLAVSFTLIASLGQAESAITPDDLPPWFKPELQVHLVAMALTSDQKAAFRDGLTACLSRPARDCSERDSPGRRRHPQAH